MATIDLRKDGTTGFAGHRPRSGVVYRKLSVSTANYNNGTSNTGFMLNAAAAGDVVQILNIPAGCYVADLRVEVLTAGTGTISVGDSSSGTVYVSAQSCASTGFIGTMAATSKFYSAASDIRITFASANDGVTASQTPVIKVTALLVDHTDHPPATTAVL
jgi:hypothetical protein